MYDEVPLRTKQRYYFVTDIRRKSHRSVEYKGERTRVALRLIGCTLSSTLIDARQMIINNLTLVGIDDKQTAVATHREIDEH